VTRATVASPERPSWDLTHAVLVYSQQRAGISFVDQAGAYATLHEVDRVGGKPVLGHGVPATKEACADLARALGAAASLTGFVPPQLVYLGARSILWWRPAGPARIFFDTTKSAAGDQAKDKAGAALIGRRNGISPQPALVFGVTSSAWFVYALADDERPGPEAKLLRAPYFNVWTDGQVCTGNVQLPDTLSPATLARYERAFFDSEFTHRNMRGAERLLRPPHGAYQFWRQGLDGGWGDDFPVDALADVKLTLAGLAKRLEKP